MAKLGSILFVNDVDKYMTFLNKWLGGEVVREQKDDKGITQFVMYMFDGIMFGITKPSEETTNTAEYVKGSTNNLLLVFDSKERAMEIYERGKEIGLTIYYELTHETPEDTNGPFRVGFQDAFSQHWSVLWMPAQG